MGVAKPPLHHSTMEYYGRLLVQSLMRAQEFAKEACSMAKEKVAYRAPAAQVCSHPSHDIVRQ